VPVQEVQEVQGNRVVAEVVAQPEAIIADGAMAVVAVVAVMAVEVVMVVPVVPERMVSVKLCVK
jgi:hypothetical protein